MKTESQLNKNEVYLIAESMMGLYWNPEDKHNTELIIGTRTGAEKASPIEIDASGKPIIRGSYVASGLEHEIHDAIRLDALDEKWEVDGRALLEKLRAMTPEERLRIVSTVKNAWKHCESPQFDEILSSLAAPAISARPAEIEDLPEASEECFAEFEEADADNKLEYHTTGRAIRCYRIMGSEACNGVFLSVDDTWSRWRGNAADLLAYLKTLGPVDDEIEFTLLWYTGEMDWKSPNGYPDIRYFESNSLDDALNQMQAWGEKQVANMTASQYSDDSDIITVTDWCFRNEERSLEYPVEVLERIESEILSED